jgi:hypothetical protein
MSSPLELPIASYLGAQISQLYSLETKILNRENSKTRPNVRMVVCDFIYCFQALPSFPLTRSAGQYGPRCGMAQFVMAHILGKERGIIAIHEDRKRGEWYVT